MSIHNCDMCRMRLYNCDEQNLLFPLILTFCKCHVSDELLVAKVVCIDFRDECVILEDMIFQGRCTPICQRCT